MVSMTIPMIMRKSSPMTIPILGQHNSTEWFGRIEKIQMDQLSMATVCLALEYTLTRYSPKEPLASHMRGIGKLMATRLMNNGFIAPGKLVNSWEKAFRTRLRPVGGIYDG